LSGGYNKQTKKRAGPLNPRFPTTQTVSGANETLDLTTLSEICLAFYLEFCVVYLQLKMSLRCITLPSREDKLIHQKGNLIQYQAKINV